MSDFAIQIETLAKRYRLGATRAIGRTFGEMLYARAARLFDRTRNADQRDDEFWALRDVSINVQRGEVLGLIGRNGAGKSTLLKILSRITDPTEGRAVLRGRLASLLEVGTGFHPELSGRENIYLSGAVLGMRRREIATKFDQIVDFSGIGKFLDTPVKRYSSGMYVRLAFAVAAHLEADILLVDEVLAVGDAAFQRKCLGTMSDVASSGRTVLFVSHNMNAVRQLCDRAVWLQDGRVHHVDEAGACVDRYLGMNMKRNGRAIDHLDQQADGFHIDRLTVNQSDADEQALPAACRCLTIEASGRTDTARPIALEARLCDSQDVPLASFSSRHVSGPPAIAAAGQFDRRIAIGLPWLTRGEYLLHVILSDPGKKVWARMPRAVRLVASGTPSATGTTFDYNRGAGWMLLDEAEGAAAPPRKAREAA